jgi:hypothetical protein
MSEFISGTVAGRMLGVTRQRVDQLVRDRKLRGFTVETGGRPWTVLRLKDVQRFASARSGPEETSTPSGRRPRVRTDEHLRVVLDEYVVALDGLLFELARLKRKGRRDVPEKS